MCLIILGFVYNFNLPQHTWVLSLAEGYMMWPEGGKDEGRPGLTILCPDKLDFTDLGATHCFLKAKNF